MNFVKCALLGTLGLVLLSPANIAYAAFDVTGTTSYEGIVDVAVAIDDLQITGEDEDPVSVKLLVTSGTLEMATTTGLTFTGAETGDTLYFSGSKVDVNAALASLTYTRGSTGSDTLEVSLVEPGEVFFPDNGHLYEYISSTLTWTQAEAAAEALTRYGSAGYLTTITSAEENDFVADRLENAGWMGASDAAVEDDWKWVTGPETGTSFWSGDQSGSAVGGNYENWNTGEPNDSGSNEDCGQFLAGASGLWNDLPCSGTTLPGYVVEFGAEGDLPEVAALDITITIDTDIPPTVSITSPTEGQLIPEDTEFAISATSTDSDGTVESVKFYINDNFTLIFAEGPYTTEDWIIPTPGEYTVFAVAEDDDANVSTSTVVTFTVTDTTAPTIETVTPLDNATEVGISTSLAITFDEAVDAETGTITLKKTADNSTIEEFDVASDISGSGTDTITFTPAQSLAYETGYYIQIDATAFDDTDGNSFAGISSATTWSFTTGEKASVGRSSLKDVCKDTKASNYNGLGNHKQSLCEYEDDTTEVEPGGDLESLIMEHSDLFREAHNRGIILPQNILMLLNLSTQEVASTETNTGTNVRDLELEMEGEDVAQLQALLISQNTGPAALELVRIGATGYFGTYTHNALGEYQEAHGILPHAGYFGAITRAQMTAANLTGLWW